MLFLPPNTLCNILQVAPSSNLAEAVNASYAHKGSCSISLVRAAYEDTADSILLEKQWDLHRNGAKTCATGPSASNRTDREMAKQKREVFDLWRSWTSWNRENTNKKIR